MDQITLGDVVITRVEETHGPIMAPGDFFPGSPNAVWEANKEMLSPDHLDPETNLIAVATQTWVLQSEGKTILIDTGVGNGKERPYVPQWGHLNTDFLGNLERAGFKPEDVDVVVNTHLHVDHVGWNTYLEGNAWVPTFPNAVYLMAKADFDFWNPVNETNPRFGRGNQNVFEDSVLPVHQAGQTILWEERYSIDGTLTLELAPGHTPGSSVLKLVSGSDRALFAGDLLHTPLQIVNPDMHSCFCEDIPAANATRRRLLGWAADANALVLPAHLVGHGGAEVARNGDAFAIKRWAPFAKL